MNLQVGVKALIKNSNQEYLVMRRSNKVSTDTIDTSWDIPGGRIDRSEPLLDALKREIYEETGHSIISTPKLLAAQDIFVEDKNLHVVRLTYLLEEDLKEVMLSVEHDQYKWLDESDLAQVNLEPYLTELIGSMK